MERIPKKVYCCILTAIEVIDYVLKNTIIAVTRVSPYETQGRTHDRSAEKSTRSEEQTYEISYHLREEG